MEVFNVKISELVANDKNPRKISKQELGSLVRSIKEFGFVEPVIVNKNPERLNIVIGGHQRLEAARVLEMVEVPVSFVNLSREKESLLNVALNQISGSWDEDKLYVLLKELDLLGEDLSITGFEDQKLLELLKKDKQVVDDEFVAVDAYERLKNKNKTKIGDLFALGNHRLMCGDATKGSDVTKLMNGNEPILMVTDPPYGVNYDPKWRDEADKKGVLGNNYPVRALGAVKNDDRIDWSEAYKLFKGDVVYVYHAGKYSGEVQKTIEDSGFEVINQIIWVKPHFALSRGDYHWKHEPVWYAIRKGSKHNWQGSRKEHTVWEIAGMNAMGASHDVADERTGHGTQKPVECMAKPIRNSSEEGQGVYDPFGGSGSALIACERLNRKCYMMEIDPVYCQVIIERWEKLTGKRAEKVNY